MKKILICLFMVFSLFLSGCDKDKPALFLSSQKLTPYNFSPDKISTSFKEGQRVYFLLYYPKDFISNIIRVQILKLDVKMPIYAFSMAQARDIEIEDINDKFIIESFCLHKEGTYLIRIFTYDRLDRPVIQQEFNIY